MPEQTRPEDFAPIFSQDVVIVGGHAVNLWAMVYAARGDAELLPFAPFTSKDADIFIKDRELAEAVAAAAGWRFQPNTTTRSAVIGRIVLEKQGEELCVDVLRSVRGLTDRELDSPVSLDGSDGRRYLLPSPDLMLKAKLANLASIDQSERQDARHVRILVRCCAHFLVDACDMARAGAIEEREVVELFMRVHRLVGAKEARSLDAAHGLSLASAIPVRPDLDRLPKVEAFYRHQLRRH